MTKRSPIKYLLIGASLFGILVVVGFLFWTQQKQETPVPIRAVLKNEAMQETVVFDQFALYDGLLLARDGLRLTIRLANGGLLVKVDDTVKITRRRSNAKEHIEDPMLLADIPLNSHVWVVGDMSTKTKTFRAKRVIYTDSGL